LKIICFIAHIAFYNYLRSFIFIVTTLY